MANVKIDISIDTDIAAGENYHNNKDIQHQVYYSSISGL